MVKRGCWIFSLLLLTVFLSSCNMIPQGEQPGDTAAVLKAVQTGTQGVEVKTLPRYPPQLVYDQNELVAMVEIRNRGNHDLQAGDCFLQITGFDQNIITGWEGARSCAENVRTLEGKNVYNLQGGFNQLEFKSSNVRLPDGVYDYNPMLNFVSCYKYHTKARPQICVDPLFYQITADQKSCLPKDVSMAGGQGAPVGVSFVGVDMIGSKAVFEINIQNYGVGKILSPDSALQGCAVNTLEYKDLDKVRYNVELTGGSLVDCRPSDGMVQLFNNQGKIVCTFTIPGSSAYETPLLIDLDYNYLDSFQQAVKIVKTPQ